MEDFATFTLISNCQRGYFEEKKVARISSQKIFCIQLPALKSTDAPNWVAKFLTKYYRSVQEGNDR